MALMVLPTDEELAIRVMLDENLRRKPMTDPEAAADFCQKESDAIRKIYAHIDFMDEHRPDWLDDNLNDIMVSTEEPSNKTLSERATRLLRSLKKTNPEIVDEVLEEVCQLERPTNVEVKRIIQVKSDS